LKPQTASPNYAMTRAALIALVLLMPSCAHLQRIGITGDGNELRNTWDAGLDATWTF
jgi:hypothetical protein